MTENQSTEINHLDPWGGMSREHYEAVGAERTAAYLAQKAIDDANPDFDPHAPRPLTPEEQERKDAIARKDACHVAGCPASPNLGHKHDVHNPFNKPADEVARTDARREAQERSRPKFDHGLVFDFDDEAWHEKCRRERLHAAWRNEVNYYGVSEPYLLISPFTEADLEFTSWRPWGKITDPSEIDPYTRRQAERFAAILDALDNQHEARHWFYQHPFCRGCFPDEVWEMDGKETRHSKVAPRLANWMLKHGERGFPADDWDGHLPSEPPVSGDSVWMTLDDIAAMPAPRWLIPDLVPAGKAGFISGPSNVGKSFLGLDWAMQVALDERPALFLAGEGVDGFGTRIEAWMQFHDCDDEERQAIRENLKVRRGVVDLFAGGSDYEDLLKQIRGAGIVVIDTLSRARGEAEENSNTDMGVIMRRIDEIKSLVAEQGGSVVVIAHTAKAAGSGIRGAGVTLADQDFDWRLEPKDGKIRVTNEKSRDSAKGEGFDLVLHPVEGTGSVVITEPFGDEQQWSSDSVKARVAGALFVTQEALTGPAVISAVKDDGSGKPASKTAIYEALTDLEKEGTIERLPGSRKGAFTYRSIRNHFNPQGA